ncbi:MAG: hypothetical protein Kow0080_28620 [Candidatus Promineifilaceae bacterium]
MSQSKINKKKKVQEERPFPEILQSILKDETLSVSSLFSLTDMNSESLALFEQRWPEADDLRRQEIARHLADITEENFVVEFTPVFRHLLQDPLPAVRLAALDGLWDCTNIQMVRPIIELMQTDSDTGVRAAAASTLAHYVLMAEWGQLPKRILPRIEEALLAEIDRPNPDTAVFRAALEALGSSSHERVPAIIEQAYHHDLDDIRLSAIFAMGASADRRWVPIIIQELTSPSMSFRAEAARAAGSIGSSDFLTYLQKIIAEDDDDVALVAVEAVGLIGGDLAKEILQGVLNDADAEMLHEAADEAIEEMGWLDSGLDLSLLDFSDFEEGEGEEW